MKSNHGNNERFRPAFHPNASDPLCNAKELSRKLTNIPVKDISTIDTEQAKYVLCDDIAFQHYCNLGSNFAACYKLSNNQFFYLEDDAADIVTRRVDGESVDKILRHYAAIHGEACISDLKIFIAEWDARLFKTNAQQDEMIRAEFKQSDASRGEGVEQEFIGRCNDGKTLCSLTCELTYACQQRCLHCYNPHHNPDCLSTELWCNIIEQAAELGVIRLCLTGGECTQHPGFWRIVEKARSHLMAVTVQSNGIYFDSQDKMSRLASLYPRSYEVSLYAATPELHDHITGIKGSWVKTRNSLAYAKQCNIPIAIKCPAMKSTIHEVGLVAEIANELGAGLQIDLCITSRNDGDKEPLTHRIDNADALVSLLRNKYFPFYRNQERMFSTLETRRDLDGPLCGAGGSGLSISPSGNTYPCASLMLDIGNVKVSRLGDIWKSETLDSFRKLRFRDNITCSGCADNVWCSICPGVSLLENNDMLRNNPYDCFLAKSRKRVALSIK